MTSILAVDDDEKIRDSLSMMLLHKAGRVLTADHGQKGIDVSRRERPHVTILDCEMPDRDGLAVLREILTINPLAPVVRLKGVGTEQGKQQARE